MKPTRKECLIAALRSRGCRDCVARTRKYVVLTSIKTPGMSYFIGDNGALRFGKNVSESRSLSSTGFYNKLLREGEALLTRPKDAPLFPAEAEE